MITIVLAHPWHGSFNKAILDKVIITLKEKNKNYKVIDLNKDNFDPVLKESELKLFKEGGHSDELVSTYQDILDDSQELIFIFPIWWYNLPAILKGFIDKVMLKGFAYSKTKSGLLIGSLGHIKRTTVVTTSEAPTWYLKVIGNPIKRVFTGSTLKQVGLKKISWLNSDYTSTGSDSRRNRFLDKVTKYIS